MKDKLSMKYLVLGIVVIGLLLFVEYRGLTAMSVTPDTERVPTSVRDNPGAYRAHYVRTGRYVGGK